MEALLLISVKTLVALFLAGVMICALLIPVVALKFFGVLLEKDPDKIAEKAAGN
ncbi:MAG: hypothetical protein ACE14M_13005 [Terriglobales bacterium]